MKRNYLVQQRANNVRFTRSGSVALMLFFILFIITIIRIAVR